MAFTFLFSLLIFILSCDNDVDIPQDAAGAGYGKVAVTINGASARTVFPTMTFAKYEYFFAKVTNGTPGTPIQEAPVGGYFTLELGEWQLTVKAYAKTTDTAPAATGTSATFAVTSSTVAQVAVHLSGNAAAGTGNFVYTITYPAGAAISAFSLKNLQNDAIVTISASGASPLSGSRAINAGYYFLTIQLTEGGGTGRTTGSNEVVYIYDKLDSEYSKTFSADDFSHIHQWGNWAQTTAPTCMAAGWDTRTCSLNAGHNDTRPGAPIDPDAHNYGNWVTTAPTCTTTGRDTRTCSHNAAHTETRAEVAIDPNAHDWNTTYTTIAAVTVTTDGIEAIMCKLNSSHTNGTRTAYATGTPGLSFTLINSNTAYRVSRGTATGAIFIPAYRLYNGNYLPVTYISDFGGLESSPNTAVTSVTFAEGSQLQTIGQGAFYNCTSLTSITIPASVTSIDSGAFNGCTSLPSITIPASVTFIDYYAFVNCDKLTNISVAVNNPNYASQGGILYNKNRTELLAFPSASGNVTIPAGVTSIGQGAFGNCRSLTSITIPAGVTSIGYEAFYGCTSLTDITLPASLTSIGGYAFSGCTELTSITVNASNSYYASQDGILYNKAKTEILIIPEKLTGTVTIPEGITSIGNWAFTGRSLTSITIPAGVTSIGSNAFGVCTSLTNITVDASNPHYASQGGILYNKNRTELLAFPSASGNVAIPAGVTSIGDYAFYICQRLTNITLPNVTSIGNYAFYDCTSLTGITIPASVTSIGNGVFIRCTSLTNIEIPSTVTTMGYQAFYQWRNTQIIYIKGHASESAADSAWGSDWRSNCNAVRRYWNGSSYQ